MAVNPHDTGAIPAGGTAAPAKGTPRRGLFDVFDYSRRALVLVWTTNKALSIVLAVLTLVAGILPAGIAYVGALIVDAVIHAADLHRRTGATVLADVVTFVAIEALLVAATSMAQRGISLAQSLLRAQLGQRVNVMILEKEMCIRDSMDIEQDEIPLLLTQQIQGFVPAGSFTNGVDAGIRFQKLLESRANDRVIVGDQYS